MCTNELPFDEVHDVLETETPKLPKKFENFNNLLAK